MLLSFKFLIAYTEAVELFSEENVFVFSIRVVLASRFFSHAEQRRINHLCWSSDLIDTPVVVSLNFTLHLYFGNVFIFLFLKQSTRCWRSFDW